MGVSQAMASAFVVLGTFLAAAFVRDNTGGAGGWRWAYYFNGIIYGLTALSIAVTYFPPRPLLGRHHVLKDIILSVDYIGILTMSGAFASLIIGLTWGGSTYAWNSPQVIATLTVGCVGLLLFGLYEAFVVKEGIFRPPPFPDHELPNLAFRLHNRRHASSWCQRPVFTADLRSILPECGQDRFYSFTISDHFDVRLYSCGMGDGFDEILSHSVGCCSILVFSIYWYAVLLPSSSSSLSNLLT